jgi:UDPglucose 6-dehydrogenase
MSIEMSLVASDIGSGGWRSGLPIKRICCIGAGYVGGPTCAVIADKCPDIEIHVVDLDANRIKCWNEGPLPIHEPGIDKVILRCRERNLFFSTNVGEEIEAADLIFVSVNTPTKQCGIGAGQAADLKAVESAIRAILEHSWSDKIIVEKSTVPCGTARNIRMLLETNGRNVHFEVLSNPEFLAEGTAISDLNNPDRVLIGGMDTERGRWAQERLAEVYAHWVPRDRILTMRVWSSELAKLSANAMLAQRVSSINALSAVCEAIGADVDEVASAVGHDSRLGSKFLKAGLGFGGSCFQKDILNLIYLAGSLHLPEVAAYWKQVIDLNLWQKRRFLKAIVTRMFDHVAGKKIAIFGFAFKKDTGDTRYETRMGIVWILWIVIIYCLGRESPAIDIVGGLLEDGARVYVYDPVVRASQMRADVNAFLARDMDFESRLIAASDPYTAAKDADAIVVCTDWDEFRELDYERLYALMRKPAFVFDGRLILDQSELNRLGFEVFAIGKA